MASGLLVITSLLVSACSGAGAEETAETESESESALTGPSAKAQGLTVEMSREATFESAAGELSLVLRGKTNRTVSDVFSWVPDDAFGQATRVSARVFEVRLRGASEINSVLSGMPLNLRLTAASGAVRDYTAQLRVAPFYTKFTGDKGLVVEAAIAPVYAGPPESPLRYRSSFSSSPRANDAAIFSDSGGGVAPRATKDGRWIFDRTYDGLAGELDAPSDQTIFEVLAVGETVQKRASIAVRVEGIALTADDPYNVFPPPVCTPQIAACLKTAVASGDVSGCGTYREVSVCLGGPSECLFGWTVDALLANPSFTGRSYQRIESEVGLPSNVRKQLIRAAKTLDSSVSTVAGALALGGGFAERHSIERLATGTQYDVVTITSEGARYGAVFRADKTTIAGTVRRSMIADCKLLRAPGGAQVGEGCAAAGSPCGQGLSCLGENPAVGFGKCVPRSAPNAEGTSCGEISGKSVACPTDELVCAGLSSMQREGLCLAAWKRQRFDDWTEGTLVAGGTFERAIETYGLATVAIDSTVSAEVVGVVPSTIVVRLMNPAGSVSTIFDGPKLALTEPDLDSDNFIELSEDGRFSSDESANGPFTLLIETKPGAPVGQLANWHLTITSQFD